MSPSEEKPFYKIGEVCDLTGTQPYVLRFWESEFPSLAPKKNRSGQRIYRKRDIELIKRIKTLLYEQEYTIAGARKILETEPDGGDETPESGRDAGHAAPAVATKQAGRHAAGAAHPPGLPSASASESAAHLEAEVRNLRAKLAHVEGELRAILDDMERRDRRSGQHAPSRTEPGL
jgi:DNA-binding transcriptional MerR regulator